MGWNGPSEEVRRRERVIRIFPNRESTIRLLGAVLMERHEQWTTGHRYLDMASYWQWRQGHEQTTSLAIQARESPSGPSEHPAQLAHST